jgi:hypothetical protein
MTPIENIEQLIKPFLLRDISFTVDSKTIKSGKLILFAIKDFFCVFTLTASERDGKRYIYEIPYPFTTSATISSLEFNYTLDSFCLNNTKIIDLTKKVPLNRTSKLFNKKVVVIANIDNIMTV